MLTHIVEVEAARRPIADGFPTERLFGITGNALRLATPLLQQQRLRGRCRVTEDARHRDRMDAQLERAYSYRTHHSLLISGVACQFVCHKYGRICKSP